MATPFREMSRRSVLGLGAAASGAAALAACGGGSGGGANGSVSLRFAFWGSDDRVQRFTQACELFTEKNPNIRIEPEFGDIDSVETKTTVGMASGQLPDVIWTMESLFPQMVTDGHLVDLDQYLGNGIDVSGFSDSVLADGQVDGTQYAIAHGLQSSGVFAKVPTLEEAGIPLVTYPDSFTWEEYAQYCQQIHDELGPDFYGTDDPNYAGILDFFRAWVRQQGRDFWAPDGDVAFTREDLSEWLSYWEDLRESGGAIPTSLALEENPYFEGAPMIRDLAGFHMRNSNQMLELQKLSEEPLHLMPVPGNGGDGASSIALVPNQVGIAQNTQHLDEAILFLDFLLNDPDRAAIIGTTIGAPATEEMREAAATDATEGEKQFLDYIGHETSIELDPVEQAPPTGSAFQSDMGKAIETMAYGQSTVEETVDTVFGALREQHLDV